MTQKKMIDEAFGPGFQQLGPGVYVRAVGPQGQVVSHNVPDKAARDAVKPRVIDTAEQSMVEFMDFLHDECGYTEVEAMEMVGRVAGRVTAKFQVSLERHRDECTEEKCPYSEGDPDQHGQAYLTGYTNERALILDAWDKSKIEAATTAAAWMAKAKGGA